MRHPDTRAQQVGLRDELQQPAAIVDDHDRMRAAVRQSIKEIKGWHLRHPAGGLGYQVSQASGAETVLPSLMEQG